MKRFLVLVSALFLLALTGCVQAQTTPAEEETVTPAATETPAVTETKTEEVKAEEAKVEETKATEEKTAEGAEKTEEANQ